MKSLSILSFIINILFYCLLAVGIAVFVALVFCLLGYNLNISSPIVFSEKNKLSFYFILVAAFSYYTLYLYSIFLFKKNIESFTRFKLFTNQVIKNFRVIGVIYLIGYLGSILAEFIFPLIDGHFKIEMGVGQHFFNFPLNGLIIGLFFIILSQVFQIAKNQKEENIELKQENELTI